MPKVRRLADGAKNALVPAAMLVAGSLVCAFAVNVFYVPIRLTMGGVTGVVSIIYQLSGGHIGIPFGAMVLLFNLPLFLLGVLLINRRFVLKSLIGTAVYSAVIDLTAPIFSDLYVRFLSAPSGGTPEPVLFCVVGGVVYGCGIGIVMRQGFTQGGSDIIAVLIRKYTKTLSIGQLLWVLDAAVVFASAIAYMDVENTGFILAMYSAIAMFLTSKAIDFILEGFDYRRSVTIITTRGEAISGRILREVRRGVTGLDGKGMYTGNGKQVLICVVTRAEIQRLKQIVHEEDPDAFVTVTEVREVLGEGFEGSGLL
ncbi:MAG: YitT family protein [Clostridia bacterium]|nr:YitT family protein [Clostridia bacterium]